MTIEIISWSIFIKVMRLSWDSNSQPLDLLSDMLIKEHGGIYHIALLMMMTQNVFIEK